MDSPFDLVCLFGYSPFFVDLSSVCAERNIRCALIFGPRQQDSIETLCFPEGILEIKIDSLVSRARNLLVLGKSIYMHLFLAREVNTRSAL